jgi:branched-chain amino acid transport system permease protein
MTAAPDNRASIERRKQRGDNGFANSKRHGLAQRVAGARGCRMNLLQTLENILQTAVAGLLTGSIYGLMCVGLAMIFGVMRVINFAQGDFMMLGMYAAYYIFGLLGFQAVFGTLGGTYLAILLAVPVLYFVGYGVHALLISRVSGTRTTQLDGEGHYAQLILTLGIALMMTNGAQMVFGSVMAALRTPLTTAAWEIPLGGISVFLNKSRGIAAVASVVSIVLIGLLISRSALGRSLRAAADNPVAATYMGIDVNKAHRVAFAMGVSITALAGGLLATNYPFHPFVGLEYVIVMYAGVVLGGMGSIIGAFWGGLTIGLVQQMSTLVLPTQLQNTAIFVVFLLIIFFRPQGFFGRNAERT